MIHEFLAQEGGFTSYHIHIAKYLPVSLQQITWPQFAMHKQLELIKYGPMV